MAARIRKDDTVIVLAGKDKGRSGRVLKVMPKEERVLVEGVNMVKRHTEPNVDPSAGRRDRQGSVAARLERGAARSEDRQAHARRLQALAKATRRRKVRVAKGSGVQIDV